MSTTLTYSPSGGSGSDYSHYSYDSNTNLLSSGSSSFPTDGNRRTRYTYDANGNVTYDSDADIIISYNILNLPDNIFQNDQARDNAFVYTADGKKVGMTPGVMDIYYFGPFRYEGSVLKYVFAPGAFFEKVGTSLVTRYTISDHLGSTRAVVDAGGTVIQQNDYSPWGEKIHSNDLISGNFPYLYGGKENLELFDIPYYDSFARLMTTDGVFLNADPLAEASYATGPWAYCAGNPLSMMDPDGRIDWKLVCKGIGETAIGLGEMVAIASTVTASSGIASPFLVPATIASSTTIGLGITSIIVGLTTDSSEDSIQQDSNQLPTNFIEVFQNPLIEILGDDNGDVEFAFALSSFIVSGFTPQISNPNNLIELLSKQISIAQDIRFIKVLYIHHHDNDSAEIKESDNHDERETVYILVYNPWKEGQLWQPRQ